ncbi:hypothetical protein DRW42_01780 [Pedobacter miscanthi]|uniref:Uncharacterized protein n=1 Tax=Pedobacter miscanthi TaxID=2259170 RepID=A0A366LDS1_9SPHI|nr:hypothetical protein DRW42_01780 [Pedobacter miscanthi]
METRTKAWEKMKMFGSYLHKARHYFKWSVLFGKAGFGSFGLRKPRYTLQSLGSYLTYGFYAAIGFRWQRLPKLQKGKASATSSAIALR